MSKITQPTPEELRQLILKHGVTRSEAAALVHVSINAWHKWSANEGSSDHRAMPLAAWELLLLKLGEHPTKKLVDV
ncbi:transcriptional regulator [Paraburkholderia sediminicola]|uniref:transcriptional regulator n=1 Tax=Paraburkholderia sediminicola TaxID=458836 RepID=UPI0038B87164